MSDLPMARVYFVDGPCRGGDQFMRAVMGQTIEVLTHEHGVFQPVRYTVHARSNFHAGGEGDCLYAHEVTGTTEA